MGPAILVYIPILPSQTVYILLIFVNHQFSVPAQPHLLRQNYWITRRPSPPPKPMRAGHSPMPREQDPRPSRVPPPPLAQPHLWFQTPQVMIWMQCWRNADWRFVIFLCFFYRKSFCALSVSFCVRMNVLLSLSISVSYCHHCYRYS